MRRSIICFIVIASLIICSTSIAFANPLDPWTSVQADRVTNGVVSIDNTLSNIYTGLTALYNYLKNNGDGVVEGLLVLANRVSNIINTLDYYLPLQNSVLQNLYSFFAAPSGDTRDIWDLLSQISANTTATSTALNTTNSELLTIDSHVDGVESSLTSIGSRLDTTNVNLQSLESISWSNTSISFSNDNITYYSNLKDLNNADYFYIKLVRVSPSCIFHLHLFSQFNNKLINSDYNITFNFYYNNVEYYPDYFFNSSYNNLDLFIYPFSSVNDFIIKINLPNIAFVHNYSYESTYCRYIPFDSNDFYTVDNFIQNHKKNNDTTLSDIKNILIDIDNNSDFIQNNNDLQINVDIDPSVGQGVTGVISKIQDLLDFGISLQEFIIVLNQFDNLQWFTRPETYDQVNQDPRYSPGYIDLYD